ncbi:MAG: FAD-dependent oxidoreductase [Acidimicrobiia bacterium]|nr:FAD-dependent oxidoreductase [Acidimicrobiia bacterium]
MEAAALSSAEPRPLWWDAVDVGPKRAALAQDIDVDVLIVGAGYTGLWTAFFLQESDPALSIAIVERDHVGFGASGRNGGFCYDGFAAGPERVEAMSDLEVARRWSAVLRDSVGVVGDVTKNHGIDCDFMLSGTIEFCSNGGQLERAEQEVLSARRYGWTEEDLRMLGIDESLEIARAANVRGGMWSRLSAPIHPAKLVHGLASVVESRGTTIYERTPALDIGPGQVALAGGRASARVVVRATEGYTSELPGHKRRLAPLYSLMIATEPLSEGQWNEIGLASRESFGDMRHLVIYGQRTADGRIAFGGRGAPYDFGSKVRRNADFATAAFEPVHNALLEVFPQLADVAITHRWGGVLGVSRQWQPTAGFDRETGQAWAGGYVGSGVTATNLAGRTLAALITGDDVDGLTRFPWVNHGVRNWEPEPLRWLGINTALRVMRRADTVETRTDRAAKSADWLWRLVKY